MGGFLLWQSSFFEGACVKGIHKEATQLASSRLLRLFRLGVFKRDIGETRSIYFQSLGTRSFPDVCPLGTGNFDTPSLVALFALLEVLRLGRFQKSQVHIILPSNKFSKEAIEGPLPKPIDLGLLVVVLLGYGLYQPLDMCFFQENCFGWLYRETKRKQADQFSRPLVNEPSVIHQGVPFWWKFISSRGMHSTYA